MHNYYKKLGHIKADCCVLKAKNGKAQRSEQKGSRTEEVNFIVAASTIVSSAEILLDYPNILVIKNMVQSEVLYMTEEATSWLLDSGASYHVTPDRS